MQKVELGPNTSNSTIYAVYSSREEGSFGESAISSAKLLDFSEPGSAMMSIWINTKLKLNTSSGSPTGSPDFTVTKVPQGE